jgi:hypothetical protein
MLRLRITHTDKHGVRQPAQGEPVSAATPAEAIALFLDAAGKAGWSSYDDGRYEAHPVPPLDPLEIWRSRVLVGVRHVSAADAEAIAQRCLDAQRAGTNAAVWHQAARFYGKPCQCHACATKRRR